MRGISWKTEKAAQYIWICTHLNQRKCGVYMKYQNKQAEKQYQSNTNQVHAMHMDK